MGLGHTRLARKIWSNRFLYEPGKVFSRFEAWLYIVNRLASGIDTEDRKRGEFDAPLRRLARVFNWSKSRVERFLEGLQEGDDPMIKPVYFVGRKAGRTPGRFIVCKYWLYNPLWDALRDAKRDTYKESNNINTSNLNKTLTAGAAGGVCPETLRDIFQEENQVLPDAKDLTRERAKVCRARINQAVRDGCLSQYLEKFRLAIRIAQSTPFLRGEGPKGWKASFDWFISSETNVQKTIDGNYIGGIGSEPDPELRVGEQRDPNPERDPVDWDLGDWVHLAMAEGMPAVERLFDQVRPAEFDLDEIKFEFDNIFVSTVEKKRKGGKV